MNTYMSAMIAIFFGRVLLMDSGKTSQQVPVCADSSSPRREQLRRVDKGLIIFDVSADDEKVAADLHQN